MFAHSLWPPVAGHGSSCTMKRMQTTLAADALATSPCQAVSPPPLVRISTTDRMILPSVGSTYHVSRGLSSFMHADSCPSRAAKTAQRTFHEQHVIGRRVSEYILLCGKSMGQMTFRGLYLVLLFGHSRRSAQCKSVTP